MLLNHSGTSKLLHGSIALEIGERSLECNIGMGGYNMYPLARYPVNALTQLPQSTAVARSARLLSIVEVLRTAARRIVELGGGSSFNI